MSNHGLGKDVRGIRRERIRVFERGTEVSDPEAVGACIPGHRRSLAKRHVSIADGFGKVFIAPIGPFTNEELDPLEKLR